MPCSVFKLSPTTYRNLLNSCDCVVPFLFFLLLENFWEMFGVRPITYTSYQRYLTFLRAKVIARNLSCSVSVLSGCNRHFGQTLFIITILVLGC